MRTIAKLNGMVCAMLHNGIVNDTWRTVETHSAFVEGYWIVLRRM